MRRARGDLRNIRTAPKPLASAVMLAAFAAVAMVVAPARAAETLPPAVGRVDSPRTSEAATLLRAQEEVFRAAARRVAPSVVTIETVGGTQPLEGNRAASRPAGAPPVPTAGPSFIVADGPTTGLIYSADGLIITSAFNFVRDPSLITVVLSDHRRFVAELLARDEVRQVAMLKIDAKGLPVPEWVSDVSGLRVGQWTLALGRGLGGEEPSMSTGIISGLNRQSGLAIGTDARLSPVNFGGPVIALDGRVLGLAVPMGLTSGVMAGVELYDSGIGFFVPYPELRASAESLAVGHSLRHGLLGVKLGGPGGLTILRMADPSPALRSGLQTGDRVLAVEGKLIKKYQELQRVMRRRLAGQPVRLTVDRDGRRMDVPVVLGVPEDMGQVKAEEPGPETQPAPESPEPPHRDQE